MAAGIDCSRLCGSFSTLLLNDVPLLFVSKPTPQSSRCKVLRGTDNPSCPDGFHKAPWLLNDYTRPTVANHHTRLPRDSHFNLLTEVPRQFQYFKDYWLGVNEPYLNELKSCNPKPVKKIPMKEANISATGAVARISNPFIRPSIETSR